MGVHVPGVLAPGTGGVPATVDFCSFIHSFSHCIHSGFAQLPTPGGLRETVQGHSRPGAAPVLGEAAMPPV